MICLTVTDQYLDLYRLRVERMIKIEQIKINNFKVFKDTSVKNLSRLNVFVGPNGSGKTSLFNLFGFLKDALHTNVTVAVNKNGGFDEIVSRNAPQDALIRIGIKYRELELKQSPLITYELVIKKNDPLITLETEKLNFRSEKNSQSINLMKFHNGKGEVINNEDELIEDIKAVTKREEQILVAPDILAIKGLGQFHKYKSIHSLQQYIDSWIIYNFQYKNLCNGESGIEEYLSSSGNNLAQVTRFIYDNHPKIFQTILEKMNERIPGIEKVEAIRNESGQVLLKFKDKPFINPFFSRYVSDGTIKMFAYLILLNAPVPHPLICIEEPENFLFPELLKGLADELRDYATRGGQVFVSTHSPEFVNALDIRELFVLKKTDGETQIFPAISDSQLNELFEKGNELGWLWQHGFMENF
jgi:predicted ATPase